MPHERHTAAMERATDQGGVEMFGGGGGRATTRARRSVWLDVPRLPSKRLRLLLCGLADPLVPSDVAPWVIVLGGPQLGRRCDPRVYWTHGMAI
jgi:hypothetical protein